jgi:hypothetical protein
MPLNKSIINNFGVGNILRGRHETNVSDKILRWILLFVTAYFHGCFWCATKPVCTRHSNLTCRIYSSRHQNLRFAYVTSLRVEGKQTQILCKPKTLLTQELRQRATKYRRWEIMLIEEQYMLGTHRLVSTTALLQLRLFIYWKWQWHLNSVKITDVHSREHGKWRSLVREEKTFRINVCYKGIISVLWKLKLEYYQVGEWKWDGES